MFHLLLIDYRKKKDGRRPVQFDYTHLSIREAHRELVSVPDLFTTNTDRGVLKVPSVSQIPLSQPWFVLSTFAGNVKFLFLARISLCSACVFSSLWCEGANARRRASVNWYRCTFVSLGPFLWILRRRFWFSISEAREHCLSLCQAPPPFFFIVYELGSSMCAAFFYFRWFKCF